MMMMLTMMAKAMMRMTMIPADIYAAVQGEAVILPASLLSEMENSLVPDHNDDHDNDNDDHHHEWTNYRLFNIFATTPSPGSSPTNNEGNAASSSSKRRNNCRAVDVSAINVVHSQDAVIHLFNQMSIFVFFVIAVIFIKVIVLLNRDITIML